MANEIEMNFKVLNKKGLLLFLSKLAEEKVQDITITNLGKKDDKSFYIRIEEISDSQGARKFLTAKGSFVSKDGVNERKEITLSITDKPQSYIDFLTLIGMELRDTKKKIRHHFNIDNLDITLDEWNVTELGDRVEIEGPNADDVKAFSAKISDFIDPTPSE